MPDTGFHDIRFPTDIARGAMGGPFRSTEVVSLASGHEQRNARWQHSRRKYNAGYGMKTLGDLHEVISFFEQRRGRLYGFRFRDPLDHKSCSPADQISHLDQAIGEGDGTETNFQLVKNYGSGDTVYVRPITKPVDGALMVAVAGDVKTKDVHFTMDNNAGQLEFLPGHVPQVGQTITAGFEYDVSVRFDIDEITVNLRAFQAGDIPSISLVEILTCDRFHLKCSRTWTAKLPRFAAAGSSPEPTQ